MGRVVYVNKNNRALVSIIIPCRRLKDLIYRDKYPSECEVIAVVGKEPPGRLRDIGAHICKGKYLAFIDSDAYPAKGWVDAVCCYASTSSGGPGILPPNSPFLERLSDWVYRCLPYNYRVIPRHARKVAEFPTFNLVVRKDKFLEVGGFDTDMITGEDTLLCRKLGGVFYFPDLVVYHKRRAFGLPFFHQIANYGHNRGFLIAQTYPWLVLLLPLAIGVTLGIYAVNFLKGLYEDIIFTKRL